jgi:hypothetical protein
MLPDFRFALGAIVAIALIGVAGLGLVTSVQLVREAHMGPLDDSHSLAFAGHAEWNQFYDPEAARRFAGLTGASESPSTEPPAQAPKEAQAPEAPTPVPAESPALVPTGADEHTASIPAHRIDPDIADDKPPETPPIAETPAVVTMLAPSAGPAAPISETPGVTEVGPPSAQPVASAPAASPDLSQEIEMPAPPSQVATREPTVAPAEAPTLIPAQPQAADSPAQDSAPSPRARPKTHFRKKVARLHIRHVARVVQPPPSSPGFPPANPPWPGYDNQTTAAPAWKNTGKLTGTAASRPQ